MPVDQTTYNKAAHYAPGHGYEARTAAPSSIIVHSTSSATKNTAFTAEATYLFTAALVSAHFLVGKDGAVVQFLEPRQWAAWHAGNAQSAFLNQKSIGIELHHSVGDAPYPSAQLQALADLLVALMAQFSIPKPMIDTHGQVAILGPYQRKRDPADWPHADFLSFRSHLPAAPVVAPPPAVLHTVIAGKAGAIAQEDRRPGALAARYYPPGTPIVCDDLQMSYWHVAAGDGFIPNGHVQA